MLKRPLVVGARGNMGTRYMAICRHLGLAPLGVDVGDKVPAGYDSIIIATPTARHIEDVKIASGAGVPVLCEKPLATSALDVLEACDQADAVDMRLRMVNQYAYTEGSDFKEKNGPTYYDYFKHGSDGLAWDCISILGLANGPVWLGETSPRWTCWINGQSVWSYSMDDAYIAMIDDWAKVKHEFSGTNYIRAAHQRVARYVETGN